MPRSDPTLQGLQNRNLGSTRVVSKNPSLTGRLHNLDISESDSAQGQKSDSASKIHVGSKVVPRAAQTLWSRQNHNLVSVAEYFSRTGCPHDLKISESIFVETQFRLKNNDVCNHWHFASISPLRFHDIFDRTGDGHQSGVLWTLKKITGDASLRFRHR